MNLSRPKLTAEVKKEDERNGKIDEMSLEILAHMNPFARSFCIALRSW